MAFRGVVTSIALLKRYKLVNVNGFSLDEWVIVRRPAVGRMAKIFRIPSLNHEIQS